MSDELTIQPQVQQKSNAVPYAAGGAIVGGLAGALSPVGVTKPKYASYEDILKESEDTFKSQIEKGGEAKGVWEAAKEHAEKVKNAEAEYDKKVQEIKDANKTVAGTLPETEQAAKDLKLAQENYDKAIADLTSEKKVVKHTKGNEIVPYDKNWSMTEAQRTEYKKLYTDYANEKANFENSKAYKDTQKAIKDRQAALDNMFDDIKAAAESTIDPKSTKRNAIKTMDDYLASDKSTTAIEKALEDNNIIRLSDKELIDLAGGEKKLLDKPGKAKKNVQYFEVTARDGSKKYAEVQIRKRMPGITEYQRLMEQKTRSTVNAVAEQFKTFVETQEQIDKLPETLTFEKGLVRKAGLTRTGGKIDNFADHLKDFSEKLSEYSADAKILEKEKLQNYIPQKGIKPKYDKLVQDVLDKYGVQNPKEAYEMIIARKSIGAKYQTELNSLNKILDEIRTKDKVLNELNGKFGKLRRNAKDLNIAESRIRGKFKEFLGKAESSMETVAGMSKEDAIKHLEGKDVATKLEHFKQAAEARAKELGLTAKELTDDELAKILKDKGIGTKEEFLAKTKNAAKEAIEKDLGKIKTPNKLVNGLIAGTALALVGLGIGSSMKKDQA